MKLPLSALEDYVHIKVPPEKLAEKLLLSGTKVEEIRTEAGETIFDLEITPNRPDTLSFYGIAREVAAIFNLELNEPDTELLGNSSQPGRTTDFKVVDKKLCPNYSLVTLKNITIKESGEWIKKTLIHSGIRPINNVVDITNLVMLELGQPLHAFDVDKIKGTPILRAAKKGETVTTLDNIVRQVPEGTIIIEDSQKLIDLAGLMGGKNSQVDNKTTRILLHVPLYEPTAIRKASLFTGLRTEASNRFEKKLDPNLHRLAINRAIKLLAEETGASFETSVTSVGQIEERKINFNLSLIKKVLGIEVPLDKLINMLSPLGFLVNSRPLEEGEITITVPSHRQDVSLPEDILEEVGRIYGYNNFPKTLPSGDIPQQKELFETDKEQLTRDFFVTSGFTEITGYSLVSEADLKSVSSLPANSLRVLHPTSQDFVYLRPTLLINLMKAAQTNQKRQLIAFFEIAKEFKTELNPKLKLPRQEVALALISSQTFGKIKSVFEAYLTKFNIKLTQTPLGTSSIFSYGLDYKSGTKKVAQLGLVAKNLLENFEYDGVLVYGWVDYEYLSSLEIKVSYEPLAKFPSVVEDISFFTNEKNSLSEIFSFVQKFHKLVKEVDFIDTFEKDNKLSLTMRLTFRSDEETLTGTAVNKIRSKLEKDLIKKFKITIRKW